MVSDRSPFWDVVVIGAGAAGLLAGSRSAERGFKTLVLEKNRKVGVKILMSGGTRCNITHHTDADGIMQAFGRPGRFLRDALRALSPSDVVALFEQEGVATKVEPTGKIFPASDRSLDVQQALWRRLIRAGAEVRLAAPVLSVDKTGEHFVIRLAAEEILAASVIVSTGGLSYPGCGTTGDGYPWLEAFGHTIVTPRPSLVPITTSAEWVKSLSGVTLPDVVVRVASRLEWDSKNDAGEKLAFLKKKSLAERRGSLLLAHFGLTGPAALDVSREVTAGSPHRVLLVVDFLPDLSFDALEQRLRDQCERHGARGLVKLLPDSIPHRLAEQLMQVEHLPPEMRGAELSRDARRKLCLALKAMEIQASGTRGFAKAEVTAGGVDLAEIDPKTMQSRRVPGLFVVGEILNLDGWIGGYNFQSAFSTAWLAAESLG